MPEVLTVATALQILRDTMDVLNRVRERARRSKDTDLKDQISTLYDHVLSLKEAMVRLTDENDRLRRRIVQEQLGSRGVRSKQEVKAKIFAAMQPYLQKR